jgi:predicted phage baseplate assembly protein
MAAQGGTEPEPADAIKLLAPEAFRTQERAVTEDDYARVAERHPGVQRAAARLRWTGSWYTMYLIVDRLAGRPLDQAFRDELLQFMERYRLAGYDLELADPVFVPLDIALAVCVRPGYFASDVEQALLAVLGSGPNERGEPGFFHPDRFSFGQALALSRLIEAAMRVIGVASIEVLRFQRWGKPADAEIADGRILAAPLEVLRLDNDPNFPENGRLKFDMRGGV